MARDGSGVTDHGGKVRISFKYNGKRMRQTLDMPYTPGNVRAAEKMLARIRDEIRLGTFDYAREFPESKAVKSGAIPRPEGARGKTFGDAVQTYLDSKAKLAPNTLKCYRNAAEVWKRIFGAETTLGELTPEKVAVTIAQYPFASKKLMNDYLIVLRGTTKLARIGDKSWTDPMAEVTNAPKQKSQVKPLSAIEMHRVLKYMSDHFDERVTAYFTFMFETGLRPEEAIALQWGDVDFRRKQVHICRARTLNQTGPCKTHEVRDVDLSADAIDALAVMKQYTYRAHSPENIVFQNPNTKRAWNSSRSQHENYWTPALKALHIAKRRSYNTRHTYATLRLMVGAVPAYISRQLGHESPMMLFKTYAKWLDADQHERERVASLVEAKKAAAMQELRDNQAKGQVKE